MNYQEFTLWLSIRGKKTEKKLTPLFRRKVEAIFVEATLVVATFLVEGTFHPIIK